MEAAAGEATGGAIIELLLQNTLSTRNVAESILKFMNGIEQVVVAQHQAAKRSRLALPAAPAILKDAQTAMKTLFCPTGKYHQLFLSLCLEKSFVSAVRYTTTHGNDLLDTQAEAVLQSMLTDVTQGKPASRVVTFLKLLMPASAQQDPQRYRFVGNLLNKIFFPTITAATPLMVQAIISEPVLVKMLFDASWANIVAMPAAVTSSSILPADLLDLIVSVHSSSGVLPPALVTLAKARIVNDLEFAINLLRRGCALLLPQVCLPAELAEFIKKIVSSPLSMVDSSVWSFIDGAYYSASSARLDAKGMEDEQMPSTLTLLKKAIESMVVERPGHLSEQALEAKCDHSKAVLEMLLDLVIEQPSCTCALKLLMQLSKSSNKLCKQVLKICIQPRAEALVGTACAEALASTSVCSVALTSLEHIRTNKLLDTSLGASLFRLALASLVQPRVSLVEATEAYVPLFQRAL